MKAFQDILRLIFCWSGWWLECFGIGAVHRGCESGLTCCKVKTLFSLVYCPRRIFLQCRKELWHLCRSIYLWERWQSWSYCESLKCLCKQAWTAPELSRLLYWWVPRYWLPKETCFVWEKYLTFLKRSSFWQSTTTWDLPRWRQCIFR